MVLTLKPPRPLTDEEILEFSRRNPGLQFERSATGELIVTPTGSASGRREVIVATQLERWAQQDGSGLVFGSSTGFRMPDGALLSPDASWVRRDRWDALTQEEQEAFAPLCPDAVFEIASRSDTLENLRSKMRAYLANGAQIAVLIDPFARTVEVNRPGREPAVLRGPAGVPLEPTLPGFVLDPGPIFAA